MEDKKLILEKLDEIEKIMKKWDSYLKVFEFLDKIKEENPTK